MAVHLNDLAEQVIRKLLTSGELRVGDKLSIRRLMRVTHLGYPPVRDALGRLAQEGWVEIRSPLTYGRNGGTYVVRTED